jgi:hypothetical protein
MGPLPLLTTPEASVPAPAGRFVSLALPFACAATKGLATRLPESHQRAASNARTALLYQGGAQDDRLRLMR